MSNTTSVRRYPIGLEEPVERTAQPIIAQALKVIGRDAEQAGRTTVHGLLGPVDYDVRLFRLGKKNWRFCRLARQTALGVD